MRYDKMKKKEKIKNR